MPSVVVTMQMKATEQDISCGAQLIVLYRVVLTFESVDDSEAIEMQGS